MSKRPPGGPDSYSEGIAGWNKHAGHFGDSGGDGANSDEVCWSAEVALLVVGFCRWPERASLCIAV